MAGYNRLAGTKSWKEEAGRTDSWVQSIGRYERVNGSGRYNRRKGILRHENRKGTIVGKVQLSDRSNNAHPSLGLYNEGTGPMGSLGNPFWLPGT